MLYFVNCIDLELLLAGHLSHLKVFIFGMYNLSEICIFLLIFVTMGISRCHFKIFISFHSGHDANAVSLKFCLQLLCTINFIVSLYV